MKIKESKNAFICFLLFLRIGAFQWVAADSNKKIFLASAMIRTVHHFLSAARGRGAWSGEQNTYSTISVGHKDNAGAYSDTC
jgi:hypothetical protein